MNHDLAGPRESGKQKRWTNFIVFITRVLAFKTRQGVLLFRQFVKRAPCFVQIIQIGQVLAVQYILRKVDGSPNLLECVSGM